jgi:hypothetical protein
LYSEISDINLLNYENRYVFSLKAQQFYTAIEDLLKQVAKAFENHIDSLSSYQRALLIRLSMDIVEIRPALISKETFLFLDKLRAFRHFIRHAYDCELEEKELSVIQTLINQSYHFLKNDRETFKKYLDHLK